MRTCDYLHQASSHFTDQGLRLPLRQLMGRLVLMCKSTEDLRGRAVRQLHKTGTLPQCKLAGGKSPLNPPPPRPLRGSTEPKRPRVCAKCCRVENSRQETSLARVKLVAGQRFSGVSRQKKWVISIKKKEKILKDKDMFNFRLTPK